MRVGIEWHGFDIEADVYLPPVPRPDDTPEVDIVWFSTRNTRKVHEWLNEQDDLCDGLVAEAKRQREGR